MKIKKILFISLMFVASSFANASLILDSVWGDIRGIDADGFVLVNDSAVEFSRSDFGFQNDIWTGDFSSNGMFTLKVETVAPFGNITGGGGSVWFFNNFSWSNPLEEIVEVRLVDFVGNSFSNPFNLSFTKSSITFVMDDLNLDHPSKVFTSGTFQIITSSIAVPEPSTYFLFISAFLGLLLRKKESK